jgi:hypothetical protein
MITKCFHSHSASPLSPPLHSLPRLPWVMVRLCDVCVVEIPLKIVIISDWHNSTKSIKSWSMYSCNKWDKSVIFVIVLP